jgi:hypothetical protein
MSKKTEPPTVLDSVIEQQGELKLLERDLLAAKAAHGNEREKFMVEVLKRLCDLDTYHWSPLIEWWKEEYFKRQWASGYCYACQGGGKVEERTGGEHPFRTMKCRECGGKGHGAPRKPVGDMIPAGWEPEKAKKKKAKGVV